MKCSSVCVLIGRVLKEIRAFLTGEVMGSYSGIRALVYRAREQDTLEPNERIH